jgi:hypothetical protein
MRFSTAAALLLSTSAVYGFVPANQPSSFSTTSLFSTTEAATAKKVRNDMFAIIIQESLLRGPKGISSNETLPLLSLYLSLSSLDR